MVDSIREKTELVEQKNRENEALLLNILPGADRRAAQERREPHRRQFRRGHCAVRRHRRLHGPVGQDGSAADTARHAEQPVHPVRPGGEPARHREDQDDRRRLHGGCGLPVHYPRPRPPHGRDGARDDRGVARYSRESGRDISIRDRGQHRAGRRRRHRQEQVHLRPLGRHRERRRAAWNRTACPAPSRSPGRSTRPSAASTTSSTAARSRSRAKARSRPG